MWNKTFSKYDYSHIEKRIMNNYFKHQKLAHKMFETLKHTYSPSYVPLTGRTLTGRTLTDLHWNPQFLASSPITKWAGWGAWGKKKPESFLTNVAANDTDRIERYKQWAKQLGTSIIVKDNATTITGQPLPSHRAIHIADVTKRKAWWSLSTKDTFKSIKQLLGNRNPLEDTGDFFVEEPKACSCEMNTLMRNGCQCGGV